MGTWRKSTRSSANGSCVEVKREAGLILVRDSKDPDGARVAMHTPGFGGLLEGIKRGDRDLR